MTLRFILDENVVILAQKRENDRGEPDSTCLDLFNRIIDICHTIVLDPNLWDRYHRQLNRPSHSDPRVGIRLLRPFGKAVRMDGKVDLRPHNAVSFQEESSIPQGSQDDVEIVRLAVETGATLVTTDARLRQDLNRCGVQERYNLLLLSPEDALMGL
jgi:hypothetical protein